ncbi:monocarboxylate transporter 9-like [Octopus vulgaris]|uniref:Monocarboxylate transporter 9-like n=2 Tax=Octopus vulgaris TaxID=6645 RepID=A0AA36BQH3_OCTVU|nr:monocarboxylate transporter 9-like [Octopus vulgaris]
MLLQTSYKNVDSVSRSMLRFSSVTNLEHISVTNPFLTHSSKSTSHDLRMSKTKKGSLTSDENPLQKIPIVPDGGWGWVVCIASFYCNLICSGLASCFGIMLIQILDTFQTSATKISLIGSIFTGLILSCGPLASALMSRFGHRFVIILGSIFGSFGLLLSVFAINVEMLIITFGVIGGLFTGLCFFTANVVVGLYFSSRQALAVSLATTGNGAGVFVVNYITENLLAYYGLRGTLLMLSSLVLNMAVAGALCRPLKYKLVENTDKDIPLNEISTSQQLNVPVIDNNAETVKKTTSVNSLDETRVSLMTVNASDEKDKQTATKKMSCIHSIIKNLAIFFDYEILKNGNTLFMIAIYFLWSGFCVSLRVVYTTLIVGFENLASGYSLLSLFNGIGYVIGPPLFGLVYDTTGHFADVFYGCGVAFYLGSVLSFIVNIRLKMSARAQQNEGLPSN